MSQRIREIQEALVRLGYDPGPVDGIKGPRTIAAIKQFQRDANLYPDGIVGRLTALKLLWTPSVVERPPWMEEAYRLIGVREKAGKENNPEILKWGSFLGLDYHADDVPWCLTGDAEVLTDIGFVRIDQLLDSGCSAVAEVDRETLAVRFSEEFGYIEKPYAGKVYEIDEVGLTCDPEHEFFGRVSGQGPYQKRAAKALTGYGIAVPCVHSSQPDADITDDEIRFLAAFIADGSFRNKNQVSFGVSKDRKKSILSMFSGGTVKEERAVYGISNKPITRYVFPLSMLRTEYIVKDRKCATWEFAKSLSRRQSEIFVETYSSFDGTRRPGSEHFEVFTSDRGMQEVLCYIAAMAGMKPTPYSVKQVSALSKIDHLHTVYCSKMKHRHVSKKHLLEQSFDGRLYCVQVPSGVFVVRGRNGVILPIGNCGLFVAHCIASQLQGEQIPTNPLAARAWLKYGKEVDPVPGSVLVFWRISRDNWRGHVGFCAGQEGDYFLCLGGNQGNKVSVAKIHKARLLGARWPSVAEQSLDHAGVALADRLVDDVEVSENEQ